MIIIHKKKILTIISFISLFILVLRSKHRDTKNKIIEKINIIKNNTKPVKRKGTNEIRANFIIKMMKHAWSGYSKTSFGENENKPVSGRSSNGPLGNTFKGMTIIDAIDTLYIMGLVDEYSQARDWIRDYFTCDVKGDISFFEFNIRIIGGLLSAYGLTKDKIFLDKVTDCAERLYEAGFNDNDPLPNTSVDLSFKTGFRSLLSLAQSGTFSVEFTYLSTILKNPKFQNKVDKYIGAVKSKFGDKPPYQNHKGIYSIAEEYDSFYEYLIKNFIQTGKKNQKLLNMFIESADTIYDKLTVKKGNYTYLIEKYGENIKYEMSTLSCFAGAMYFLASKFDSKYISIGEEITAACIHSYDLTKTKIGPEKFNTDGQVINPTYSLRPEVVESLYLGYYFTNNVFYQDVAWKIVQAIETHCKVKFGYSGIINVNEIPAIHDDIQQSFFLAETLKYLYLIFTNKFNLDEWVFNTEGHPFPIGPFSQ